MSWEKAVEEVVQTHESGGVFRGIAWEDIIACGRVLQTTNALPALSLPGVTEENQVEAVDQLQQLYPVLVIEYGQPAVLVLANLHELVLHKETLADILSLDVDLSSHKEEQR